MLANPTVTSQFLHNFLHNNQGDSTAPETFGFTKTTLFPFYF